MAPSSTAVLDNHSMHAIVCCRNCGAALTTELVPVSEGFIPDFPDGSSAIPRGQYWNADDSTPMMKGHTLIHLDDRSNLQDHPDRRRHNGCCGKDGCDGPNQVCQCGHEVATLVSDCWTSFFLHFEPEKTALKACDWQATVQTISDTSQERLRPLIRPGEPSSPMGPAF